MIVCLDSGNSRIKWGVHDGERWLAQGAVAHVEVGQLAGLVAAWPAPERVLLANVAGVAAGERIREQLAAWRTPIHEVASSQWAAGVTNLYETPQRLGVDRWCALIGARSLVGTAAIVVMAGTATTIDTLDGDGHFLGGFILPGLDLMQRSLERNTAALPLAAGKYRAWPRCTDDAIASGCIEAQAGAIERAAGRLGNGAMCLLSGGAAAVIGEHLGIAQRRVDNLVLEGLLRLAGDLPAAHASGKTNS